MRGVERILVDMDGVLVDFVSGACFVHETTPEHLEAVWEIGTWDMSLPLGKIKGKEEGLTLDEFWEPIHSRELFWTSLNPLPWFNELLQLIKSSVGERHWAVCTAPSHCPTSYKGKADWLKDRLGFEFEQFIPFSKKEWLANPKTLLIDDRESNIERFVRSGGKGLLFPSYNNRLHIHRHDPLAFVRQVLETLQCT